MNVKIKPDYLGISLAALFVVAGCLALYLKNEDLAIALFGAAAGGAFLPPAARKKAAEATLPAALVVALAACGAAAASPETHAEYVAEDSRCADLVAEIERREGTTEEEDTAALEAEIARCNAASAEIENEVQQ